jgi:hypothetical protein
MGLWDIDVCFSFYKQSYDQRNHLIKSFSQDKCFSLRYDCGFRGHLNHLSKVEEHGLKEEHMCAPNQVTHLIECFILSS